MYCKKISLFLVVLAIIGFTGEVSAQDLCNHPLISYDYDCSTIPEEAPDGVFTVLAEETHDSDWYSDGDKLHIDACAEGGQAIFYRNEPTIATSKKMELFATIHITCEITGQWVQITYAGIGLSDGVKAAVMWPYGDASDGSLAVETTGDPYKTPNGTTNWSLPHVYKLVLDKSSEDPAEHFVEVFLKTPEASDYGDPVLHVPYSELPNHEDIVPNGPETPYIMAIGAAGSDSIWDNVGYNIYVKREDDITLKQKKAKDFFGITQRLDHTILEQRTFVVAHKIKTEAFHQGDCWEIFGGWSHVVAGKNATRDTDWHIGFAVFF